MTGSVRVYLQPTRAVRLLCGGAVGEPTVTFETASAALRWFRAQQTIDTFTLSGLPDDDHPQHHLFIDQPIGRQ